MRQLLVLRSGIRVLKRKTKRVDIKTGAPERTSRYDQIAELFELYTHVAYATAAADAGHLEIARRDVSWN